MSDIITLANQIAAEKENIRQAITDAGVSIPESTPLSEYAGKISLITHVELDGDVFYKPASFDESATSYTVNSIYQFMDNNSLNDHANLTTINTNNVTYIGDRALSDNPALTTVSTPNATIIGDGVFEGCVSLASYTNNKLQIMGDNCFSDCPLTSFSFPNLVRVGIDVNSGNTHLTSVNLPKATHIGTAAFRSDSNLTSVTLPKVKHVGASAFNTIGNKAYADEGTTFELSLPELETVGTYAFDDIRGLTSLSMPKVKIIQRGAFEHFNRNSISTINIPECVYIDGNNFRYYTNSSSDAAGLDELTVADDCVIEYSCFYYQPRKVNGKISRLGDNVFHNTNTSGQMDIDLSGLTEMSTNNFNYMPTFTGNAIDFASLRHVWGTYCCYYNAFQGKVWLSKDCEFHGYSNFEAFNHSGCHIYTDAETRPANWTSYNIAGSATWHYDSTHEDFENA